MDVIYILITNAHAANVGSETYACALYEKHEHLANDA